MNLQRVQALLQKHGEGNTSHFFVGEMTETSPGADVFSFKSIAKNDRLELRRELGVCVDPGREHVHVLARLRDVHCKRILIFQTGTVFTSSELLALGFQKIATEKDCTIYLHSAEVTDRPREWNNAKHWAHPENFDKT